MTTYTWTDNAMQGGTACDVDKVNDNLMHLKYNSAGIQLGTCSTASATTEKAVTLDNFSLSSGATVLVTFTNANTATTPTLNVNSTGAKAIYNQRGSQFTTGNTFDNNANEKCLFMYDGTNWVLLSSEFYMVRMAMPSNSFIDLTAPSSNGVVVNYTAPADGFYYYNKMSGNTGNCNIHLTNTTLGIEKTSFAYADAYFSLSAKVEARKGDTVTAVYYNATGNNNACRFIYAEGSKP